MTRVNWGRWAMLLGVPYFVLWVVGFLFSGSTPDSDASAQHASADFEAHRTHDRVDCFSSSTERSLRCCSLRRCARSSKSRSTGDGLITLGFSGMVIFAVGAFVLLGMEFAATDVPGKIDPSAEQALNVLQNDVFFCAAGGCRHLPDRERSRDRCCGALPKWLG